MTLPAERPERPLTLNDCQISTGLWRLLSSSAPAELEIRWITKTPEFQDEVKALVPRLRAVARPCGGQAVRTALQELVLVFGVGEAAHSSAFWRPYASQLSGFPAQALEQAIDEYVGLASSEFFPKPGPLKALVMKHAAPILKALSRAIRAAEQEQPRESKLHI
jgi:hypothetical protein